MGDIDLTGMLADVPAQSMTMRLRILADVYEGLLNTTDSGLHMGHVPAADRSDYFDTFQSMRRDSWLMEAAPNRDGRRRVIPTTIGELVHLRTNPARYRSTRSYSFLDGQFRAEQVTR
jgi:hypothetical protein